MYEGRGVFFFNDVLHCALGCPDGKHLALSATVGKVLKMADKAFRRGPALGGTVYRASTFSRFKSAPYALTLSKTALPTALTQGLPRCTLKVPAQSHWPRWQRSRCSSGMLLTAVDDGVVDLGRFSCVSYLAAWQQPIKPGVQQLSAALWRGRS